VSEAAAFAAWLGGSIALVADGRRGLALGLAVLAAGLAVLALDAGQPVAAAALGIGGAAAAGLRLRVGPQGWGLMPPGSTPRIILAAVAGLLALWVAGAVSTGSGAPLRFAVLATLALLAARLVEGGHPAASTTAASGIAIALGAGAVMAPGAATEATCIIAGLVAAGLQAMPHAESDGA
jgi:hypothetical protein